MKICIAQIRPVKGNIPANIIKHKTLIEFASSIKASSFFFPELSLTGYEPELAKKLATDQDDKRLDVFQLISDTNKITIEFGLSIKSENGIKISMIIFQPNKKRQTYSKQQLHSDEFPYFENGDRQIILTIDNKKIAPAICYESLQANHSDNANKLGAEIYIASVAKSQNGIDKGMIHYPEVAKKYTMPVLMANCVGFCYNFLSIGKSSVWNKQGNLVGQLDDKTEGFLIFDTETEVLIAHTI